MSVGSAGWVSTFPLFRDARSRVVRVALNEFLEDASPEQVRAWDDSIPRLQTEVEEVLAVRDDSGKYTAILEYQLPLEGRRPDAVFLVSGSVVVVELKGKSKVIQADVDQAAAYARDLRAYHRECQQRPVHAVLVPTRYAGTPVERDGVWVTSPEHLDGLILDFTKEQTTAPPSPDAFLSLDAYQPLPGLVEAARELFSSGDLRTVWRAHAATDPAVQHISAIAHRAAKTKTRHLVLVTGVPGSGKTLVGLRAVHSGLLDDLAVEREGGKPTVPGLFLSGNGPLVQVLQYSLKTAGGGGRTFVRHIKDYLDRLSPRPDGVPPEHMLVFDEAQRAFSEDMVRAKHPTWPHEVVASEPALFVRLCERIPQWSVLVGLIGTGQEIHVGEEEGLGQWRTALEQAGCVGDWTVHAPAALEDVFVGSGIKTEWAPHLNLNTELRYHLASDLHQFVERLLSSNRTSDGASRVAERLWGPSGQTLEGLRLWATRDFNAAKRYLADRYSEDPDARFGILASSRDKGLARHGIDNSWQATRRLRVGPWFADGEENRASCRHMAACATEFQAQGLELDMALLAWGTDFRRLDGAWDNSLARGYKTSGASVRDPLQLRLNAYRVLLTRGRDGTVVFVPPDDLLDETWQFLLASGFRELPGSRPDDELWRPPPVPEPVRKPKSKPRPKSMPQAKRAGAARRPRTRSTVPRPQDTYLVAFFLAKYGHERLGLGNQGETFAKAGTLLGVKKNTLKNYRDRFDPFVPSQRRGWWQAGELTGDALVVFEKWDPRSEDELWAEVQSKLGLSS